ncbi:hypothetical protein HHK36_010324 [Tetracentron sinense]|uniref:beta-galactosidase n=1 Tax=Tetracentron sinense TaxID=13715 RepID=A0A835DJ28_TETSI|nr:hypothetical protein HHK36_010324 [Tetracentron sinense]
MGFFGDDRYRVFGDPPYQRTAEDLAFSVAGFFSKNGTLANYYMYYGGTNFGRTSSSFVTTRYYDEAPLDEYGLQKDLKWGHLRDLHSALRLCKKALLWGRTSVQKLGKELEAQIYEKPGSSVCAASCATTILEHLQLQLSGVANLGHVMHAFINGEYVGSGHVNNIEKSFIFQKPISLKTGTNHISLLGMTVGFPVKNSKHWHTLMLLKATPPLLLIYPVWPKGWFGSMVEALAVTGYPISPLGKPSQSDIAWERLAVQYRWSEGYSTRKRNRVRVITKTLAVQVRCGQSYTPAVTLAATNLAKTV